MARSKAPEPGFWQENRSLITSGIVVLVILALGFLAFDSLSKNSDSDKDNDTKQEDQQNSDDSKNEDKDGETNGSMNQGEITLPTTVKVASGDSLWKLAQKYYSDGYKWTIIAKENNLSNPDVLTIGADLRIPKVEASSPATPTASGLPTNYTVVRGDTLWELSIKYYGSGYEWYRIRDANAGKVGLLPNGRPLIEIGTVLTIPK